MALPMLGGGGLMMNPLSTSMSWSSMQPNSPCWLLPQKCHTPISAWCWTTLQLLLTSIKWGACTPPLAMRLLGLYGIGQKAETFSCLLPSSQALRPPWQIFIPRIFGKILIGCLTLWCSNSFLPSPLFQRLTSLQADWTANLPHLCPGNRNLGHGQWMPSLPLLDCSQVLCFPSL